MTPEEYEYHRRANMSPHEVMDLLSPILAAMVKRWAEEDAEDPSRIELVAGTRTPGE